MSRPIVFISYSHKDEDWKDRLVTHLGVLHHQGLLDLWDDRRIGAGDNWYQEIQNATDVASVAVLLVSANSLTSDFILKEEVRRLLQRRDKEGLHIFPLIIKPCDWEAADWLRRMQLRPRDGRPISGGNEHQVDIDLTAITKEIRLLLSGAVQRSEPQQWILIPPNDISIAKLPITGGHLFGRELELDLLDGEWADGDANVISLVAWGGVGKSALVNHWLGKMAKDHYRGARRVYGWSFYSQGTRETAASADEFIDTALRWFGDTDPTAGSPWNKGERLARLVRQERTLLILDGLEPLQNPPGPDEGRLKDPALAALVRELSAANPGLCVITTRHRVADIEHHSRSTAPIIELEHLSDAAGAELLRALGVQGPQEELQQASREFGGHSLALNLLGTYLRDVFAGDVRRRSELRLLEEDEERGGHARRVMASYEKWLGEGLELAVLRLVGLFDRPADGELMDVLRAPPAIVGLPDSLTGLGEPRWRQVLARLRRARLLAEADPHHPDTLDAHPLVREYFGQQLRYKHPEAWREGHNRLYEYFKRTAKALPDTIEEMAPLYAAVIHGCQAGHHQEAFNEVYWPRILRGDEFFSKRKLGSFGADLAALSSFFEKTWSDLVPGISEEAKGVVLNSVGYDLGALGMLQEAAKVMEAAMNSHIHQEKWKKAAIDAGTLCDHHLSMGNLTTAVKYARRSVELADRSQDVRERWLKRASLGGALHQLGLLLEAEAAFLEATEILVQNMPQYPILFSVGGFRHCELLLGKGEYLEVQRRAGKTLQWAEEQKLWPRDIALDHLLLGSAHLLQARQEGTNDFTQAVDHLERAVEGLRQTGYQDQLPRGLLAWAELRRMTDQLEQARADIDEALSIATRGGMDLHQADAHLEYARLYLAIGEKAKARESLATAKEMIERMGYHRRDKEVAELEKLTTVDAKARGEGT